MKLNKVHHVAVICSDYERSKQFYTDVLGMNIKSEHYREKRDSWKADCYLGDSYVVELFGQREYPEIYSRVSMFVNIVGAIGAPFWALFGKNYPMLFTVAIVLLVVVLLLGIFCFGKMKGLQEQWTE